MERLSVFDIYKIGVGPSSSHTLGPWKAAMDFVESCNGADIRSLTIDLYGSLSKTGRGHATDVAVIMGLLGHDPETVDTDAIDDIVGRLKAERSLPLPGNTTIPFDPESQIVFNDTSLPQHPNALRFTALQSDGTQISQVYFSVGGGFITKSEEKPVPVSQVQLKYPIDSGADLIAHTESTGMRIDQVVYENELVFHNAPFVRDQIMRIYETMVAAVYRGCHRDGALPGGLNVRRRAKGISEQLLGGESIQGTERWLSAVSKTGRDFNTINKWISCFALAVNEENASLGRIVTSPTNGASGVIPAVLLYHRCFGEFDGENDIIKFMLTSGEIGCIFKKCATISAAVGGCQAEIGVSSAMAAGGLAAVSGATPRQVLMAAEIAMEHHLGLTCDPIGGLVQIPCIERNTMGAIKAITACSLALSGDPSTAIVDFDTVVKTMWETAKDMHHKYKETADGGLAMQLPVVLPNC